MPPTSRYRSFSRYSETGLAATVMGANQGPLVSAVRSLSPTHPRIGLGGSPKKQCVQNIYMLKG